MTRRKEDEKRQREVRLWLGKKQIPYQRYRNLPNDLKDVLCSLVCIPTHLTSPLQRRKLYKKLCYPDIGGRDSVDPVDFMPQEQIDKFFEPLAPSETLSYLEKF